MANVNNQQSRTGNNTVTKHYEVCPFNPAKPGSFVVVSNSYHKFLAIHNFNRG